ncbi:MAG: hypothetical protein IPP71_19855 [Bacteroidetes bacterium]|nr:hypothetical protein [Bacteroidota bacterium]
MNVTDTQAYALITIVEALRYGCKYYRMTKTATGLEPIEIVVGKEKVEQRLKDDMGKEAGNS